MTDNILPTARLTEDEIDDALFRGRDRAWVAAAGMFDEKKFTYQALADRIDRTKSQVYYWLKGSSNMTLKTLGLLAEGMDVDLEIRLVKRAKNDMLRNYCHPSIAAENLILMKTFDDQASEDIFNTVVYPSMKYTTEVEEA